MAEEFKVNDYVWFTDEDGTRSETRGQIGIVRSITYGKTAHVEYQGLGVVELPVQGLMHCHKEVPSGTVAALSPSSPYRERVVPRRLFDPKKD